MEAIDRAEAPGGSGAVSCLVKTVTLTTYPTVAKRMYAVVMVEVACVESEGATPTITARPNTEAFFALNIGSAIPPTGTNPIVADLIGGLWTFRFD